MIRSIRMGIFIMKHVLHHPPSHAFPSPIDTTSNNRLRPLRPPLRRAHTRMSLFLPSTQPGLQRLTDHALSQKVNDLTDDDQDKSNWIHPMDAEPKHLYANGHAPEASSQQADVEEGGRAKAKQDGSEGVK